MADEFTPYSTVAPFFGAKPTWVTDALNQQRIQSYDAYERIYWTAPDVFAVQMRGSDSLPVYMPTARTIVDTTHRYVVPDLTMHINNRTDPGETPTADTLAARMALSDLLIRENFTAKFTGAKRYGIIHGDWVWFITGNELKPQGARISITALDPSMYFPVMDPEDVSRTIGVKLALPVQQDDKTMVRVQTYMKVQTTTGNTITVEEGIYEVDEWEKPDAKAVTVLRPKTMLPPTITQLPVYAMKNFEEPGNPFGSSEMRGFERMFSEMSQVVSDEGLALALEGLGAYETDAPEPIDPITKVKVPWRIGPGRVIHHPPGTSFDRVAGVGNVAPFGDHYDRIFEAVLRASSSPDVAVGQIDVQVATSGIALALQLSPILSKAQERGDLVLGKLVQMFYDILTMWYPAYEATTFTDIAVTAEPGQAVPVDRDTRRDELNDMFDRGIISTQYYRSEMEKLGYVFPDDIDDQIAADKQVQSASIDATANRLLDEAGA
jgi:hypothetical protein